jgi:hypothetical protein
MKANFTSSDPLSTSLWGMDKLNVQSAWTLSKGANVVVAVDDTGVDYRHEDLVGNIWSNPNELMNGIDDDGNGYVDDVKGWDFHNNDNDPLDDNSHGTHVAGTIAAVGNNGFGVIGVAPMARIMPVKGLDAAGSGYTSNLAKGIVYAAMNGADVVSNSWGCSAACPSSPFVEDAVRTAYNLNVVVVFAAGNSTADAISYSPNNMREVISVAASDASDAIAYFSNYGSVIDVAAPGSNITSTVLNNQYGSKSGTSMATPHVSGLAALILSLHPEFTVEDVRQAIQAGTDDIANPDFDIKAGYGRINAYKSLLINVPLRVMIADPQIGQVFNIDQVKTLNVNGTAKGTGFSDFSVSYRAAGTISAWQPVGSSFMAVDNSLLGQMAMSSLPTDNYLVRVQSYNTAGQKFNEIAQFHLDNPYVVPPTCVRAAPTVTYGFIGTMAGVAGQTLQGTIYLKNNNSSGCPDEYYGLSYWNPVAWVFDNVPNMRISSGASSSFNWRMHVPLDVVTKQYFFQFYVKNLETSVQVGMGNLYVNAYSDNLAPVVKFTSPLNGAKLALGRISVQADAQDPSGIWMVKFLVDGKWAADDKTAPYGFTWNTQQVPPGIHTLTARAWDNTQVNVIETTITVELMAPTTTKGRK